jgi:hypothetical protein
MIGHKVPAYDARMHKLQKVNAAPVQTQGQQNNERKPEGEMQYPEEIWIAEQPVDLYSKVLDEPEKLLVELRATAPLSPGVYAIHWGALEGYDSIDPRIFLFELKDAAAEPEEGEGEGEGEGETDAAPEQSNAEQQQ